ncbi:hypothetical protein F66182_8024 [Fusarium sp. NRRL 66182]|nr:hypothetical protein F66182_8024 [Fusarium sp. NRRL 66182]
MRNEASEALRTIHRWATNKKRFAVKRLLHPAITDYLTLDSGSLPRHTGFWTWNGETFILFDAGIAYSSPPASSANINGGGDTADAAAFMVTQQAPLRLSRLVVEPRGDDCGSLSLNQAFGELLYQKLENETCLEANSS